MPDITMPRLSDSMEEGTILKWLKAEGDEVSKGEELVEIETDKATMTYEADAEGMLEIVADEGSTLAIGEVIARIGEGGGSAKESSADGGGEQEASADGDDGDSGGGTATKTETEDEAGAEEEAPSGDEDEDEDDDGEDDEAAAAEAEPDDAGDEPAEEPKASANGDSGDSADGG